MVEEGETKTKTKTMTKTKTKTKTIGRYEEYHPGGWGRREWTRRPTGILARGVDKTIRILAKGVDQSISNQYPC